MRNLKIGKPLPGEHKEPFRKILVYCHVFLRNIAIRVICPRFLKNCFYRSGGNRSTDRFWGVYTEIPLYSLTKRPVLSDEMVGTLHRIFPIPFRITPQTFPDHLYQYLLLFLWQFPIIILQNQRIEISFGNYILNFFPRSTVPSWVLANLRKMPGNAPKRSGG